MTTTAGEATWSNAGTDNDDLIVSSVTLDPNPPVKGKDFTVTLTGTLRKAITSGTIRTTVKFGMIKIDQDEKAFGATGPGPIGCQGSLSLGSGAPSGKYGLIVVVLDQNSAELAVVDASFSL
ncbi:ML domain-containing protein [Nocardia stercoris]|uniref:MD-2-related lipid-recognition domain-containing protein n=1 Tax=Nocardia stercoris TaxID=2483361 RepID=A0A3M2L613_9NOCA|nr:ML domain-containing protein [Nocardia stercoris]RMI32784.1 hypothetical protein EBN03_12655 [Nocardia stercoris]